MPDGPVAYFFTWTCYGTWLHGDERGSVDKRHNVYNTPRLAADESRRERASFALSHDPQYLTEAMRRVVEEAVREHCAFKKYTLLAVNIRTNHAHAVVATLLHTAPDRMLAGLKARATMCLREAGLTHADAPVWTSGGSKRWLWDEDSVVRAIEYVVTGQGLNLPF